MRHVSFRNPQQPALPKKIADPDPENWTVYNVSSPETEAGTWDGHRERLKYDHDRLRQKIAEWDSNDDCLNFRLNPQQRDDLKEANEFKEKEFPEKPAPSTRDVEPEPRLRQKIAEALREASIPPWAVAGLIVLIIAALVDPEPFTKVVCWSAPRPRVLDGTRELVKDNGSMRMDWIGHQGDDELQSRRFLTQIGRRVVVMYVTPFKALVGRGQVFYRKEVFQFLLQAGATRLFFPSVILRQGCS
jgi:hypothetical protein